MASRGTPSPQQTINQAKRNLANTRPGAPKAQRAGKMKPVRASKPKLPRQTQNMVNKQKKIDRTTAII